MRTIVDIPKELLGPLTKLARKKKVSRAALVREAIKELISAAGSLTISDPHSAFHSAFGIWHDRDIDGVEYEQKIRAEWER